MSRYHAVLSQATSALGKREVGNIAYKNKQYQVAINMYTASLEIERNSVTFCNRGMAFKSLGKIAAALDDLQWAIQLNPDNGKAFYQRACLFADAGEDDEAWTDLLRAERITPNDKMIKDKQAEIRRKLAKKEQIKMQQLAMIEQKAAHERAKKAEAEKKAKLLERKLKDQAGTSLCQL